MLNEIFSKLLFDVRTHKKISSINLEYAGENFCFSSENSNEIIFIKDFFSNCSDITYNMEFKATWDVISCEYDINEKDSKLITRDMEIDNYWDGGKIRKNISKSLFIYQLTNNEHNFTFIDINKKVILFIKKSEDQYNYYEHLIHILREPMKLEIKIKGYIDIHGASIRYQNKDLLLVGDKGCGKTTLLIRFLDKQATYVSNDSSKLLFENKNFSTLAWPHYLRLAKETIKYNEKLLSIVDNNEMEPSLDGKYLFTANDIIKIFDTKSIKSCGLSCIILPKILIGDNKLDIYKVDNIKQRMHNIYKNNIRINIIPDIIYEQYACVTKKSFNNLNDNLPLGIVVEYGTKYQGDIIDEVMCFLSKYL